MAAKKKAPEKPVALKPSADGLDDKRTADFVNGMIARLNMQTRAKEPGVYFSSYLTVTSTLKLADGSSYEFTARKVQA